MNRFIVIGKIKNEIIIKNVNVTLCKIFITKVKKLRD